MKEKHDDEALEVFHKTLSHYPENKEILKSMAHIYHERGVYDGEAELIYRKAVKENPNDLTVLMALTKVAEAKKDYDLAIQSIEKLVDLGQFNHDLVLQLAEAYRNKKYSEPRAAHIYQAALKENPEDEDFIILLAETYLRQESVDPAAIHAYQDALQLRQDRDDLGRQLIKTYIENKRFEQASKLAGFFLERLPGDEELKRLLALADLQSDKLDEAISEYKSILKKDPNDKEALVNIAVAYTHKRLFNDEAVGIYRQALQHSPEHPDILRAVGSCFITRGRISEGLKYYDKAIQFSPKAEETVIDDCLFLLADNPDCMEVRWYVCNLLLRVGRLRECLEELQYIFESDPSQTNNIIPIYRKILEKDPQNVLARIRYGVLLKILGQMEEARKSMEQAYRLQPGSAEVSSELTDLYEFILEENEDIEIRFKLGKIYLVSGEYDKAISCFQKTAQDFRWENDSIKNLGLAFVQKGMLDLALQEFKKLPVDEEMKEILYDLGQRYENKNDLVGAKQVYRIIFAADINYRNVRKKFELLAGSTSDPIVFEKTTILNDLSEKAKRRYELLEELGRGAMGIVYRARDNELEDIVALKILPDNLSNNPEALKRFKSEARSARRLSHQNIVRIHDIGEEMGRKYISMEFVDGTDLKAILRETGAGLKLRDVAEYISKVARALSYAHSIGIIHRDIKPANIMLSSDGEVKVTDFGIAKMMESTDATVAGAVIGTPLYMSPEQVRGHPVDNRADIYSLGITMYELLSGKPPFHEGDLGYQHLHVDPKPIPGIPSELMDIVLKCLNKDVQDRWESADELADALENFLKTTEQQ